MAADWKFFATTIRGTRGPKDPLLEFRDELPLDSVSIVDRLNGPGSLSGTLPLRHPKVAGLETENTLIVAERNGHLLFGGPILDLNWSGGDTISLQAEGAWNLVRRRFLKNNDGMTYGVSGSNWKAGMVSFVAVDQFYIARDLIRHTEADRVDLRINVVFHGPGPFGTSGRTRRPSYEEGKLVSIGEAIEELAEADKGFDWEFSPVRNGPSRVRFTLDLYYPNKGVVQDVPLEWNGDEVRGATGSRNVLSAGLSVSSANRAIRFTALGAGQGTDQLKVSTGAQLYEDLGSPYVQGGSVRTDITQAFELIRYAVRGAQVNRDALAVATLVVDPDVEPKLEDWGLGDTFNVSISDGWAQMVDAPHRVIARTIGLDKDGSEEVAMELAPVNTFGS